MVARSNPFFSTTQTFFAPSVGDKVDSAIAQGKAYGHEAQAKADQLLNKGDNLMHKAGVKGRCQGCCLHRCWRVPHRC